MKSSETMLEDKLFEMQNRILVGISREMTLNHFISARSFVSGICLVQSLYRC